MKKIFITYITGIGNTVLFLPSLRLLREKFNDAYITVIVRYEANKQILETTGFVDKVLVINPAHPRGIIKKLKLIRELRNDKYDIGITPFTLNRFGFNLLSFLVGAEKRIACRYAVGFYQTFNFHNTDFVDAVVGIHEIEQQLRLLEPLGIPYNQNDMNISLDVPQVDTEFAEDYLSKKGLQGRSPIIGFHVGSTPAGGDPLKRWPSERFTELGKRLIDEYGATIFLFGRPDERELLQGIDRNLNGNGYVICDTTILQSAALITRCHLFIANDSGPMHIAVAVDTPTISIWGPSDHIRDGHQSEKHTIIRANLDCSPCKKYPYFQYGGSYKFRCIHSGEREGECMKLITVDDIMNVIRRNYETILSK